MDYSGDVSPLEAWSGLERDPRACLVDVRTVAEWTFVGLVDLSALGKSPICLEWQHFPGLEPNSQFVGSLAAELRRRGVDVNAPLYFLCRSGGRSRSAAQVMTASGFLLCFNVAGGFEGDLNDQRHRGELSGWKVQGLPWLQS